MSMNNPSLLRAQTKKGCTVRKEGIWEGDQMTATSHLSLWLWWLRSRLNSVATLFVAVMIVLLVFVVVKNGDLDEVHGMLVDAKDLDTAAAAAGSSTTCDLFAGRWVFDNVSYPLYSEEGCKFLSDQSACEKFGRRDLKYRNWRWQPHGCDLPKFNATRLLARLRNKRMVFVGDSLNRNQWNSMICLLGASIPDSHKTISSNNGSLVSFHIKGYNASIDYYWAPLLVESNSDDPVHHRIPDRIVRAESIKKHAKYWTDADILVFNSFLWWRRPIKVLWGSFEEDDGIYKKIKSLRSYELALRTWSDWLEFHIDRNKTQLFFVGMSPTHLWADEWGKPSEQNCYNESEMVSKEGYWGRQSDTRMMRAVEAAIKGLEERGVHVQMLNITQLTEYRKDGHPSIYRKQWEPLTQEQQENPTSYADCIHWCLPGVPDVWNELLYAYIFSQ